MELSFKFVSQQQFEKQNNQDNDIIKKIEDFQIDEDNEDRATYDNMIDILFVVDTTGSMNWCIDECKKTILHIIEKFTKLEFNLKFALECYRDHPPQELTYVEQHTDLTSAKKLVIKLQSVQANGGGDEPEAVMDGLKAGLEKTNWRKSEDGQSRSKRFLFHICDAPPHGKEYGSQSSDKCWYEKGCPCGTKKEDISILLKNCDVNYHLVKCGQSLDLMEQLFQQCFKDQFCETINVNIANTQQLSSPIFHEEVVSKIAKKIL